MVISNYLEKFTGQICCLLTKFLDLLKRNHNFRFPLYFLFVSARLNDFNLASLLCVSSCNARKNYNSNASEDATAAFIA